MVATEISLPAHIALGIDLGLLLPTLGGENEIARLLGLAHRMHMADGGNDIHLPHL